MSMESLIYDALKGLVANRVYPDIAPDLVAKPYITWQQIGGESINFLGNEAPDKFNGHFQVNVWADTRSQASTIAKQAEAALRAVAGLQTEVIGAMAAIYEPDTKLRGTMQDFSFWSA